MRLDKGTIITAVLAVVLWFALVPQDHEPNSGEPRVAAYWWIMLGTAAILGFVLGRQTRPLDVAVALAGPQVVAALFTAPRGDGDGLWVLWIPLLVGFGGLLILPASLGERLRRRIGST